VTRAWTSAAIAALLAAVLLACPAHGEEPLALLAVADAPGPGPELVALAARLRDALAARDAALLTPEALRQRMTSSPPTELGELDRAFAGAVASHGDGDFEPANRALRGIVGALEALPDGPEVLAAWTRAVLRLARSEQELGRGVEAQAQLERLLCAAPELRADPRQFPPSFQRLVEDSRERLRALGTRRLTVEGPGEARVVVDGRDAGAPPVTLDLPPGHHRVTGLLGGLRAPSIPLDLTEDRTLRLDLSLPAALRPDAGPGLALPAPDRTAHLLAASSHLALARAVVVALEGEGAEQEAVALLLDVRRGRVERKGRILLKGGALATDAADALAAWLLAGEPSPLVKGSQVPALAPTPAEAARALAVGGGQSSPPKRRSSALGWSAVAAGAVALAAGTTAAVLALDAQGRYDDARAMLGADGKVRPPDTVAAYNAALAEGDRRRDAAIGFGIAAGAGAVTSAVLGYVSWRRTGEIGPLRF
jgi:hypothetical protein